MTAAVLCLLYTYIYTDDESQSSKALSVKGINARARGVNTVKTYFQEMCAEWLRARLCARLIDTNISLNFISVNIEDEQKKQFGNVPP